MPVSTSTTVNACTITKGAFRHAWKPFWGAALSSAFITIVVLIMAKTGLNNPAHSIFNGLLSPALTILFLALWGLQIWITWRPAILNKLGKWALNSFLAGAGALVGAAIILTCFSIDWRNPSIDQSITELLFLALATTIVSHVIAAAAAFLSDNPHRTDARLFRLGIGTALLLLVGYVVIMLKLG